MNKVYQELATAIPAFKNCQRSGNLEWMKKWQQKIENIQDEWLPSGSGFDCGCTVDIEASELNKIVIYTDYHHLNEAGYYNCWTDHEIVVTPDFISGFTLEITGKNRNDIHTYMYDVFATALGQVWTEGGSHE